jgi:hypothetical protein
MRGLDDGMRMPLGTDGDRQHRRITAHTSRPGNRDQVRLPVLSPARTTGPGYSTFPGFQDSFLKRSLFTML